VGIGMCGRIAVGVVDCASSHWGDIDTAKAVSEPAAMAERPNSDIDHAQIS